MHRDDVRAILKLPIKLKDGDDRQRCSGGDDDEDSLHNRRRLLSLPAALKSTIYRHQYNIYNCSFIIHLIASTVLQLHFDIYGLE